MPPPGILDNQARSESSQSVHPTDDRGELQELSSGGTLVLVICAGATEEGSAVSEDSVVVIECTPGLSRGLLVLCRVRGGKAAEYVHRMLLQAEEPGT